MRLLYIFRNSECLCSTIFITLWSSNAAIQPQAGPWQPLVLILAFEDYIGLFLPSFCGLLLCLRVVLLRPPWLGRAPGLVFPSLAHSCPPNTEDRCADPFIWGSILGLFQISAVLFQKLLHFSSFFLGSEPGGGTYMAQDVCGGHMTFSGLGELPSPCKPWNWTQVVRFSSKCLCLLNPALALFVFLRQSPCITQNSHEPQILH